MPQSSYWSSSALVAATGSIELDRWCKLEYLYMLVRRRRNIIAKVVSSLSTFARGRANVLASWLVNAFTRLIFRRNKVILADSSECFANLLCSWAEKKLTDNKQLPLNIWSTRQRPQTKGTSFLKELATNFALGLFDAGVVFCHWISPANSFLGAFDSLDLEHQSPPVCWFVWLQIEIDSNTKLDNKKWIVILSNHENLELTFDTIFQ
jgi:hypothetical protein